MTKALELSYYVGEGFAGPGVNVAHINVVIGPRSGPAGQAFATALASPSAGHTPFVVVAQPGVPAKPYTLFTNKAAIESEFHGNATWGAAQAGIAKAVTSCLANGVLPSEAEDEWVIISANWINPQTDDLDAVFQNNYEAMTTAITGALQGLPLRADVLKAGASVTNPFYTPKSL